ncbi:MAG: PAS domain S-box protein, partial [Deltaproteobacteria bacterium]
MWLDVTLEGISFLLVSLLCLRIFWLYSTPAFRGQPGIAQVCAGALLVSLALLLDVSDDFTSLNFLVVVGDTPVEAFLEKVGYFAGYLMLAIGFAKWLPVLKTEQELRDQLRQSNSSLEQANHALKLQKDLYRAITTNLKTAILLLDRQGRARLWNPAASAILGYSDQELTGRDIRIICSQALEKVGEASPIQLFSEEQSRTWRNGEGLLSTQTGEPVPVEIAVQPAHLSDEYYWLCTIEDIRERQKQQQEREELLKQLRHVQKMEAIGLLAGGIAHDFNNILSAIIGYTEVALSQSTNEQLVKRSL